MKCPYCKAEMTAPGSPIRKKLGVINRYFHCPTHGSMIVQSDVYKHLDIPDPLGDIERICKKIKKELKKKNPNHALLVHQAVRFRNVSNERRDDDAELDQVIENALDGTDFYTLAALVFSMFQAKGGMQIRKPKPLPKNFKIEFPESSDEEKISKKPSKNLKLDGKSNLSDYYSKI